MPKRKTTETERLKSMVLGDFTGFEFAREHDCGPDDITWPHFYFASVVLYGALFLECLFVLAYVLLLLNKFKNITKYTKTFDIYFVHE